MAIRRIACNLGGGLTGTLLLNEQGAGSLRRRLLPAFAALLCALLFLSLLPAQAATYYLSSSQGSNSNDGLSPQTPWRTLDRIFVKSSEAAPFLPGDSILLKKGDTWDGQIRLMAQGTASAPVLLGAYGSGAKPIVFGDNRTAKWTPVAGHPGIYVTLVGEGSIIGKVYQGSATLTGVPNPGLNLSIAANREAYLNTFKPGSFGPTGNTNALWVMTSDGLPPTSVRAFRTAAVYIWAGSSYLTVDGLDIRASFFGVDVNAADHITIRNVEVQDTLGLGIYLRLADTNCLIEGNTTTRTGNDGIYVLQGQNSTIRGNTVSHVTDNVLGFTVAGDQCGIGLEQSKNTLVEHNTVSFTRQSGIDYYSEQGSTVRYNFIYLPGTGGAFPHGTDLSVYGNIFYLGGTAHGVSATNAGAGQILVYNNVFYQASGYALMGSSSGGGPVRFLNNIAFAGDAACRLTNYDTNVSSDYNCFFTASPPDFYQGTSDYFSLGSYQSATGQDAHSIFADPGFVSLSPAGATDFQLSPNSPCREAGADLRAQGIIGVGQQYTDYAGVLAPQGGRYDIGAYEYVVLSGDRTLTIGLAGDGKGLVKVAGVSQALPWSGVLPVYSEVTLEAVPNPGSAFAGWSGDLLGSQNLTTMTMASDWAITASFTAMDFSQLYPDVPRGYWAYDEIIAVHNAGIASGYPDGTYGVAVVVTRAQMAVYMSRALASGDAAVPEGPATPSFPDVPVDHWAYRYIEYVKSRQIADGYPDGKYHPWDDLDRAQMAVFTARAMVDPTGDNGLASYVPPTKPTFRDVGTGYWAYRYIEYLASRGVVGGYPDGRYYPRVSCTRDQMAVFVARAFGLVV